MSTNGKSILGHIALGLLVVAILGPIYVRTLTNIVKIPTLWIAVILIFALILGILGWKQATGKIATIGSAFMLIVGAIVGLLFIFVSEEVSSTQSNQNNTQNNPPPPAPNPPPVPPANPSQK